MKRRPYDPLSRHGMMRTARYERRRLRDRERWARSKGFADAAAADSHYHAVEDRIVAELEAEAAELGITRRELTRSMDNARINSYLRQCHPLGAGGTIFDDVDF